MSTIAIVTVAGGGNVPPTLRIADELVRRGHHVEVLGQRRQADRIAAAGHAFRPLESLDFWDRSVRQSVPAAVRDAARLAADRGVEREVRSAVADADAALVDCLMPSSARGALAAGVPVALLFHTFLEYWERGFRRGPVGLAARIRGTDALSVWRDADARLVASDPESDPAAARRSGLARAAEWVGPLETGEPTAADPSAPPLIVVSLSTTWFPGQTDVYQRIADALAALPVRGVLTLGGLRLDRELRVPGNVTVLERADHDDLLRRASLVIGHGGHSTTFRALAHDVPLVLVPMHPLLDQPMIARSVEAAGAGRMLPRTSSSARFAAAVADVLADERARTAAARLGGRIRSTDAAGSAADALERVARDRSRGSARLA
ncbi:nucleotide disphospho-sugar-binding domain-containing protein [Agromyces sp. H66]|uniref:glycosyltransferase n=1 Tax=Agromyces sp. H66 TaxID=2529859 RepID=UPI0010AAE2D4|nr:nucleotide disphospho-sugar-binding domain-containing protein [Agromyces sp. H66]